jgi:hypothetical protein
MLGFWSTSSFRICTSSPRSLATCVCVGGGAPRVCVGACMCVGMSQHAGISSVVGVRRQATALELPQRARATRCSEVHACMQAAAHAPGTRSDPAAPSTPEQACSPPAPKYTNAHTFSSSCASSRQGPHHVAKKSITVGLSMLLPTITSSSSSLTIFMLLSAAAASTCGVLWVCVYVVCVCCVQHAWGCAGHAATPAVHGSVCVCGG